MKKIEFFSTIDGLADAVPIIEAKDYTAKWMGAARQDYINNLKTSTGRFNHIFQCPGIFDLANYGYIIPMWHDVLIKTNGDPSGFSWMVPSSELTDLVAHRDIIGSHPSELGKYLPKKPGALSSIVKINTPWNVVAPKGVKFIMLPIAYPDSYEFESTIGILDPGYSSEINVQLWWNIRNGEHVIKAGTPLAHLIPLSEEKYELVCRTMNARDARWIKKQQFFNHFTFKLKRNSVKEWYYKHFGDQKNAE